ncbi:hypothetical protein J4H92_08945 [Leucobacter weissii]|uniref:FMN-binding domain-containing protein n=1 Tax=Leucobacter weissii TaxID=1983706 RepID=A0A939MK62_9MICO|nr:hypothetical protein [Leucobacter weissii]MBO1902071.1 hypothetical protein [Leucobacter weissii]
MKTRHRIILAPALAGLALTAGLAGCATEAAEAEPVESGSVVDTQTSDTQASESDSSASEQESDTGSSSYADGEYTASGSYTTPGGQESVTVTLSLESGVVADLSVEGSAQGGDSARYQSEFIDNISSQVVGVAIDELEVSKVAGSSLTSGGFNAAIDQILSEAAA